MIIAWKKLSRRSQLLSKALNAEIWFFTDKVLYVKSFINTLFAIIQKRPSIIIVQLPQGPLFLTILLLKLLNRHKIIADVHTGFLIASNLKGLLLNTPFVKLLRYANLIIVHNDLQKNLIEPNLKKKTLVVLDPWHLIDIKEQEFKQSDYIIFPSSFAPDEPLEEIINSINSFNINVKLYITGDWKRKPTIKKYSSEKIIFTGYLTADKYHKLLLNAAAVISGTKREYTSLMSAWEALAYSKPLALNKTRALESLFGGYAVFYDWKDSKSIAAAIKEVLKTTPNMIIREQIKTRTIKSLEHLIKILKRLGANDKS